MQRLVVFCFIMLAFAGCMEKAASDAPLPTDEPDDEPALRALNFTWDLQQPLPAQVILFTGEAPGASSMDWDFGDGNSDRGGQVGHAYASAGIYEVTLTASYQEGPDATHSQILVVRAAESDPQDPDDPDDHDDPEPEDAPLRDDPIIAWEAQELSLLFSFQFDGEPDAIGWDFGDGRTSNLAQPTHAYAKPGTYTVKLNLLEGTHIYQVSAEVEAISQLPVFRIRDVGRDGAEPSIGVTSDGCIFFQASASTMRSCNQGESWQDVDGLLSAPTTFDPWLWVDPVADRVWAVNMLALECSWIAWSDDSGSSWLANPWDCGPVPGNDHIKLGSGPWPEGSALADIATFDRAVYYCVNKVPPGTTGTAFTIGAGVNTGVNCSVSLDGGVTFPIQRYATILGTGLHGAIEVAPDGTVYVPPRYSTPTVLVSKDAGLTWTQRAMGHDVGTPDPRKNSEVATDTDSHAYHVWIGADFGVYMSRSSNGNQWETSSIRISPDHVPSATFPHIDAGDPGRIAITYLGSENHAGNPHEAASDAEYHLFVTFSLNALDDEPDFTTVRVTTDPVQVGSICISSGSCVGGNRNLLDFNDLHIGPEGRVHIAFADGCTGICAASDAPTPGDSRSRRGTVAILESGPSLYADVPTFTGF